MWLIVEVLSKIVVWLVFGVVRVLVFAMQGNWCEACWNGGVGDNVAVLLRGGKVEYEWRWRGHWLWTYWDGRCVELVVCYVTVDL